MHLSIHTAIQQKAFAFPCPGKILYFGKVTTISDMSLNQRAVITLANNPELNKNNKNIHHLKGKVM
jgi:hypothetical protein